MHKSHAYLGMDNQRYNSFLPVGVPVITVRAAMDLVPI